MIPLVMVTGFLGSGKTTLLERLAADASSGRRRVFLVNEFSRVDVDGRRLDAAGARVVALPGGSIFCRCLVGEFIAHLERIAELADEEGSGLESLVVEASGVADPRVVDRMLRETGLDRRYELRLVISVVDPGTFRKLLSTLPGIRAQVEAADVVLINKCDLWSEKDIAATEAEVRRLRPSTRVVRTTHAKVDLGAELAGASRTPTEDGELALCSDPAFTRYRVALPGRTDLPRLEAAIREVEGGIYRLKGTVLAEDGAKEVDLAAGRLDVRPARGGQPGSGEAEGGEIVIIACAAEASSVAGLVARARGGAFRLGEEASRG